MLTSDTLKVPHESNKMEFMCWGKNIAALYFKIQAAFTSLYIYSILVFGTFSLGWSLKEYPAFRTKGWLFWSSICIILCSSKWLTCWLMTEEALYTLDNWAMALSHTYLSIYPDGLWWTVHSSGMSKWRYLEYSLVWCTMRGFMKHSPSAWMKSSNVHHNGDRYPVCTFPHFSILKQLVITYGLVPPSIGIKPDFVTVPYLSVSWLNVIEVRRDIHIFM